MTQIFSQQTTGKAPSNISKTPAVSSAYEPY